jgi:hypothetical protein
LASRAARRNLTTQKMNQETESAIGTPTIRRAAMNLFISRLE